MRWEKGENWVIRLLDSDAHSWPLVEGEERLLHPFSLTGVGSEPARGTEDLRGGENVGVVEGVAGGHADIGLG